MAPAAGAEVAAAAGALEAPAAPPSPPRAYSTRVPTEVSFKADSRVAVAVAGAVSLAALRRVWMLAAETATPAS